MKKELFSLAIGLSTILSIQAKPISTALKASNLILNKSVTQSSPPVFQTGYPKITNVTESGFDLLTNFNGQGATFYVILENEAPAPTAQQVAVGQTANGNHASVFGYIGNANSNTEYTKMITSLVPDVDYDVYLVAKDFAGNLQSIPTKLEVKTLFGVLPVELTAFNATTKNQSILLYLNTASEKNNKSFEIQHSVDGMTFKSIGSVDGSGNSTLSKNYSFNDENPNAGVNYYQLVQHDYDGKTSTSFIVALNAKIAGSKLDVYTGEQQLRIFISSANRTNGELQVYEIAEGSYYRRMFL